MGLNSRLLVLSYQIEGMDEPSIHRVKRIRAKVFQALLDNSARIRALEKEKDDEICEDLIRHYGPEE